ncbi:alanine racemase [Candidatus Finniella inopinata]|uniref:Alanine racemase n=1 Tax=Candidatus Finniella inopinata TaxID=1696036 RepID=A0A4Q7DIC4_9PROT|nr:alanine racemase [Candidatus Finniella inopinata]RZI45929.1 alanine racemase [Candidatus Finniella inopinata]
MSRAAIAILSTENLLHNLSVIQSQTPSSKIIALVKANAYGHGLRSVSARLDKRVYSLGVASSDEAIALRRAGVSGPITLMEGIFEQDELLIASCEKFQVVFHDWWQVKALESLSLPLPLQAWLKVDTGMGRLGFNLFDAPKAYQALSNNPHIAQPIGIMSHLACADDVNHPLNQQQIQRFENFTRNFPGLKSFCNSAGMINFPDHHYDVVRPGMGLYGVSPIKGKLAADFDLKPIMTLQTRLIAIRTLAKGSSIGYGSQFVCPKDMRVGVIAIGYGDGYPRTTREGAPILVNNVRCRIVGRVSMDMTTIDLENCPDAKAGDPVILWGNNLPIEQVAEYTSHSPYDMLCAIQNRVRFHWTKK